MTEPHANTNIIALAWRLRFNIVGSRQTRRLTSRLLSQLSFCRSDEARRLILGIGK